ncbi:hypothetical protein GCM10020000_79720 [Streptomyces olivoverticillatus]
MTRFRMCPSGDQRGLAHTERPVDGERMPLPLCRAQVKEHSNCSSSCTLPKKAWGDPRDLCWRDVGVERGLTVVHEGDQLTACREFSVAQLSQLHGWRSHTIFDFA